MLYKKLEELTTERIKAESEILLWSEILEARIKECQSEIESWRGRRGKAVTEIALLKELIKGFEDHEESKADSVSDTPVDSSPPADGK